MGFGAEHINVRYCLLFVFRHVRFINIKDFLCLGGFDVLAFWVGADAIWCPPGGWGGCLPLNQARWSFKWDINCI